MLDLAAYLPILVIVLGVVVAIAVIRLVIRLTWKVAEPNEALIISGLTRGTLERDGMDFKIVTGKGALVVPGLQTVRTLSLTLNETELQVNCVTSQGIQVVVEGVVIYKIGDAPAFIANAARRFLGQQPKMESQVYNVFEGHLRSIIGSMTMEEIIRERDKLASLVRSASGIEMEKLGLVVDSLQIKDLQDPTGYIQNLAKPHIAQVKMEARIAEATRNREASEKEAEAAAQIADAQSLSAIKQSAAQANAETARANAAQAGPLADATARQQVVVQETEVAKLEADREEQKLQTSIRKPADAKAYALRTEAEAQKSADISAAEARARRTELEAQANARRVEVEAQASASAAAAMAGATKVTGEAEAAATRARGDAAASAIKAKSLAEADGIKARAEALGTNQEAVISQQLAENMPAIVAAAAEPFAHVDQLTVLNGGEGLNSMVGGILSQVGSFLPSITGALKNGKVPPTHPKAPDAK
ncbi:MULTISPECIES: flotillin family protein [Arthrobacter]|uniref:Flotillin family protein n=1 Tax=Arthrobacter terricola TaxID=2547396 RepID=A0A4R5KLD2_9MICC|nr:MULTISPECIES: flotillin family protein [Arthrobacter]MBT8161603.1 flotillin family protein [Arthrobacter sp. GN70]TDF95270.1 flotillin family protein [Arthrobacter terricola]